jgi:simple sugar transport system permease protein
MLNASMSIILGALGVTVAMKNGSLNLGGEGQVYLGAFVTAVTAVSFSKLGVSGIIFACGAGFIFSAALTAFSGFCKARWKTNELITTFLLSNIVILIINYLVTGPFRDSDSSLQTTKKIPESLRLHIFPGMFNSNTGIFIVLAFVLIVHFFLKSTKAGYEFRIAGYNEIFARYGGINTRLNTTLAMGISGGLYGLAGSIAVLGTYHSVIKEFSTGIGWNGLATALVAGFYPPAILPSALFIAWIGAGARIATQNTGLSGETAMIVQAVIFLLSTSSVIKGFFTGKGKS